MTQEEEGKMILFAMWLAMNYADSHLDSNMRPETDKDFNTSEELSVLNRKDGQWYMEKLMYFEETVYPNYLKNNKNTL